MAYTFKQKLEKTGSELLLLEGGTVLAVRQWPEARDMGRQLFVAMADLLKEYNLKPEAIADFVVESELPDVYTSARIAETVRKVYGFAVQEKGIEEK